jgi:hypothetical protein
MSVRSAASWRPDVAEVADPLAADHVHVDRAPGGLELGDARARLLDQVRVEPARQAAVARQQHHRRAPHARRAPEQREALRQLRRVEARQHLAERRRVGPGGHHAVLRPLHLRRGHHLHRARDLARVLDGADAALELATLGHGR